MIADAKARFRWMLAFLALLIVARVAIPLHRDSTPLGVHPPETEPLRAMASPDEARDKATASATELGPINMPVPRPMDDNPRNAFVVRRLPIPVAPPGAKAQPLTQSTAVAAAPSTTYPAQPLPMPPVQIIGTWDDGVSPGVFVTGPGGTVLARQGTELMDYKVKAVTDRMLVLEQVTTKREVQLSVPRVASR